MIKLRLLATCIALMAAFTHAAETHHTKVTETSIESWELLDGGVRVTLTQMLPDQARAFFMARGFERGAAEAYAQACVFQTVLRNEGAKTIDLRLTDWQALAGEKRVLPKLDRDWQIEWKKLGVSESGRIAFRWAQFPAEQTFEPSDWIQGMTSFALPRGSRFDLKLRWTAQGKQQENTLKGVICAHDISSN